MIGERLLTCEDGEADEVGRALPPHVSAAGQHDDAGEGHSNAGEHRPAILLNVARREEIYFDICLGNQ